MPIMDEHTLDFISHSTAQTLRLGARLGDLLLAGDIICLEGELGTGKTTLARGIGSGLGIIEPITSPTFTLVAEHRVPDSSLVLYHIDVYRLGAPVAEALAFGLDDYLEGTGACIIEWADRISAALPDQRLWISLRHLDVSKRGFLMRAVGTRHENLLRRFRENTFGVR